MPDYFDEEPGPASTAGAATPPEKPQEEAGDDQTFVLPKAIAGGKTFNVGDEMVVEIVADHEDTYEVKYAEGKGADQETETPPEETPTKGPTAGGDEEMY